MQTHRPRVQEEPAPIPTPPFPPSIPAKGEKEKLAPTPTSDQSLPLPCGEFRNQKQQLIQNKQTNTPTGKGVGEEERYSEKEPEWTGQPTQIAPKTPTREPRKRNPRNKHAARTPSVLLLASHCPSCRSRSRMIELKRRGGGPRGCVCACCPPVADINTPGHQ